MKSGAAGPSTGTAVVAGVSVPGGDVVAGDVSNGEVVTGDVVTGDSDDPDADESVSLPLPHEAATTANAATRRIALRICQPYPPWTDMGTFLGAVFGERYRAVEHGAGPAGVDRLLG